MGADAALRKEVERQLAEGYELWEAAKLPALSGSERYTISDELLSVYKGEGSASLATACQCFWLFRKLHGMAETNPIHSTLIGDYFFSVFSKNLIPLDSVALNNAFARLLSDDTQTPIDTDAFLEFARGTPDVLGARGC